MKNSRNIYNIVFWSRYPFYQLTFVHVRDIVCWILYRRLNVSMRIYFASFDRNNDLLAKTIKRIGLRRWHGPALTTHNSMYLFSFYVLASLIRYHTCNCGYACMKCVILNQVWEILWGSLMILQFLVFLFRAAFPCVLQWNPFISGKDKLVWLVILHDICKDPETAPPRHDEGCDGAGSYYFRT